MNSVITEFFLTLSGSLALTILAKATVISLLGLVAGALAVRAQASLRHLVFATTFAALLSLPLVVLVIPEFPVEFASATEATTQPQATSTAVISTAVVEPGSTGPVTPASASPFTGSMPSVGTILLVAWIGGATFLMLSLLLDLMRVRHTRRHGLPSEKLRGLIDRLGVDARIRPVDLLLHERIQAPVTFGFFRPVIMLPTNAEDWSEADLRRALVHEIEHIRRADWVTQIAARIACAFYWFHPFVWISWRRLCLEAERSCDDAVVQTAGHEEYAEQLVTLSRQLSAGTAQPMLGMAKRSDLANRVASLLDVTRSRGRAGFAAAALAALAGAFIVIPIGSLRAVAQVAPKAPAAEKQVLIDKIDRRNDPGDDDDDDRGMNRLDIALFKAAERNRPEQVKQLLDQGANVNAVIPGDGSPLIAAAREGHLEMVRVLLDRGAKPNIGVSGDGNAITNAAREGFSDIVMLLLERGADINAGTEGDGNALIMASGSGYSNIVSLLLELGADIHKVVPGDENAIIKACESGQLEIVKLLVSKGADINSSVRVERGKGLESVTEVRTPLSVARKNGHAAIVEYLLSAGAKQ